MPEFGDFQPLPLRDLWPNEAANFTPWLAENIASLGQALGLDLELVRQEAAVGDFSCDLLANDLGSGRKVVIENQLAATDHDHLGKLLTYAAGLDAGVVVWVAPDLREEHQQTLEWLNTHTDDSTDFFGVVVEVFRIDDSKPAFRFVPKISPNEWQKTVGRPRPAAPEGRGEQYRQFFQSLLDVLREDHRFTSARVGQPKSWCTFPTGVSGLRYGFAFLSARRASVELYIDFEDQIKNKAFFDSLHREAPQIDAAFGSPLDWQRLDHKRASRVRATCAGSIDLDDAELENIRTWAVRSLLKMREVLGPVLRRHLATVEEQMPDEDQPQ